MRQILFVIAILVVFAALARLVWVESEILAEAYELQRLRRQDGRNRNEIRRLELEVEKLMGPETVERLAKEMDLGLGATRILPRRGETGPEAAH